MSKYGNIITNVGFEEMLMEQLHTVPLHNVALTLNSDSHKINVLYK